MHKASGIFGLALGLTVIILILTQLKVRTVGAIGTITLTTATFPWVGAVILVISGVLLIGLTVTKRLPDLPIDIKRKGLIGVMEIFVLLIVYLVLLNLVGYIIATSIFLIGFSIYFGLRNPIHIVMVAFITPLAIYAIFYRLLNVPLP